MIGDKDSDGFYHGESGGLSGYVPSNMVAEIPVDDEYLKHLLMQQGFLPVDHTGIIAHCLRYNTPSQHSWGMKKLIALGV